MFRCIVVGVAKVPTALDAARKATELAATMGAEVHYVTAFKEGDGAKARSHAEGLIESLASNPALKSFTHALPDDPVDAILRVAEEVQADLIVVGNQGMRGVRRVLGSVPNAIAHKAPCSVLIVDTDA